MRSSSRPKTSGRVEDTSLAEGRQTFPTPMRGEGEEFLDPQRFMALSTGLPLEVRRRRLFRAIVPDRGKLEERLPAIGLRLGFVRCSRVMPAQKELAGLPG
jgi:hypothetical protein